MKIWDKKGPEIMEKMNIDWGNLGFAYMPTKERFVAHYKDGAWMRAR